MSAKELTSLIMDEERLRAERANRHTWKSRVTGLEDMSGVDGISASESTPRRRRADRPQRSDEDDLEYKLAIEASKNEAEEDARRRAGKSVGGEDDDDLAKAIKLSKEEEELRRRELEEANANSLFDDTPSQAPQPTGFNQGYQQQAAVDWFGNPVEQQQQQQPQTTGFLNNAYGQSTGIQPQQTGYQNGFGYGQYQQPQQTGYDQFQQQPQQQFVQPQQTGYNPWASQMNGMEQQQPIQQQPTAAGSNNPWASATPQSPQSIAPQATGSNNPFASALGRQQHTPQRAATLSTLQEQKTATQFNQPSYNPIASYQAPVQQQQAIRPQQTAQPMDPHRAQLNALLSSGEGQDTFGNVGNTRIPAQHTAPGTFINSAGHGMNKLEQNRTGTNPFMSSQFTGMPQQQYPAQTGPAQGYGGANPYGGQQQRQQGGQGGSLIDL